MKLFDAWNCIKQKVEYLYRPQFSERDIWMVFMGENIGVEQSGKGTSFLRPVIILKKFNKEFFLGVPISKTTKSDLFHFKFSFLLNIESSAVLSQFRPIDSKRLKYRMGYMNHDDFMNLKIKIRELIL